MGSLELIFRIIGDIVWALVSLATGYIPEMYGYIADIFQSLSQNTNLL